MSEVLLKRSPCEHVSLTHPVFPVLLAGGRRRSLCGDTLSVSCVSLGRLKRLSSPCAPSAPPWTSPCSLPPARQRAPHSTAFYFKYTTLHTLLPPYRSVPAGNVTVCVFPQPLSPFFGVRRADPHGASQEFFTDI